MKEYFKKHLGTAVLLIAVIILGALIAVIPNPEAATPNPSSASTGYQTVVTYIPGAITATATPVKWKAPWPYRVLSISAYARVVDTADGSETYLLDIQQASTSILSTPMSLASQATILDGILATSPNIPDEATVSYIFTLTGTTPSLTDVTVTMAIKRQ